MKQRKLKLLFDMEQLAVSCGRGTGIVRVADELLRGFASSHDIDVYPLVTSNRGNVRQYLENAGLTGLEKKLIFMPYLRKTCKWDNPYKALVAKILSGYCRFKYGHHLKNYDAYLSVFSPISPVVYQSPLKTFAFVHDLIPVKFPQFCEAKFARKYRQWLEHLAADTVFVISESTKRDLLTFRPDIKAEKVKVAYLGADEKFAPVEDAALLAKVREKYGIRTEKYILAVSEISPRKNFGHLLEAYTAFADKLPDKKISLVLSGPVRKGFSAVADKIGCLEKYQDRIVQTGFVDDADMPALYSGAEAFVYPSLYEGFGLPVLEAMQCGVPVICAENSSLPEVGGEAVCYINGRDVGQTADILYEICLNDAFRAELKQKSIRQAGRFSWQKFNEVITKTILENKK